jgi:hypothetical protein
MKAPPGSSLLIVGLRNALNAAPGGPAIVHAGGPAKIFEHCGQAGTLSQRCPAIKHTYREQVKSRRGRAKRSAQRGAADSVGARHVRRAPGSVLGSAR